MIREADMDGDGFVNFKGIAFSIIGMQWGKGKGKGGGVMTNPGEKMAVEEIEDMIREADIDGDRFVNFKGRTSIVGDGVTNLGWTRR